MQEAKSGLKLSLALESGFSAAPFTEERMNEHLSVAFYVSVLPIGKGDFQMPKNVYAVPLKAQAVYAAI